MEAIEERDIVGAALHEDVLAIVHFRAGLFIDKGEGAPAKVRALFQEGDAIAALCELDGGRDSGQAAPYDGDVFAGSRFWSVVADHIFVAIHTFSREERRARLVKTS